MESFTEMIRLISVISLSLFVSSCAVLGCNEWSLQSNYALNDSFKMVVCKDLIRIDGRPFPENLSYEKANKLLSNSETDLSSCSISRKFITPP